MTGERVRAAILERAQQGKRTCGQILGYDLSGKDSYTINQKEAEYVRFCYEKYLIHKNLMEVAELAKNAGYTGKRGKEPTAYSICVILTRPSYCGYNTYLGHIYKGDYDPIIDVSTYNKVQALIRRQGKVIGRRRIYDIPSVK